MPTFHLPNRAIDETRPGEEIYIPGFESGNFTVIIILNTRCGSMKLLGQILTLA
jgi:hypothetical protein